MAPDRGQAAQAVTLLDLEVLACCPKPNSLAAERLVESNAGRVFTIPRLTFTSLFIIYQAVSSFNYFENQ